jgi:putative membrane protein
MILGYNKKLYIGSLVFLIIIYLVGLIGLNTAWREDIALLTPYTLSLSAIVLFLNHREWNRYFVIFAVFSAISGYLIELIGVESKIIFGTYYYGETLGYKLYGVPVIMGLNWFLMVYSCGMVANLFRFGVFLKSIIGAFLMVILDLSLEPVAVKLDFWTWENGIIPVQNYVAWFLVAFILLIYFHNLGLKKMNRIAVGLFIIQYIFFFILSYTL